jgi:hypothetical protein
MEAIKISRHFIIIIYNSPILLPINLLLPSSCPHFCIIFANQLFLLHFWQCFLPPFCASTFSFPLLGQPSQMVHSKLMPKTMFSSRMEGHFAISPAKFIIFEVRNLSFPPYNSLHSFQVHPSLWEDRLHRIRAAGLNAVQIYIPWSMHEPTPRKLEK